MYDAIMRVPPLAPVYPIHQWLEGILKPPGEDVPRDYLWSRHAEQPGLIHLRCRRPVEGFTWTPPVLPDANDIIEFSLWAAPRTTQTGHVKGQRRQKRVPVRDPDGLRAWIDRQGDEAGIIITEVTADVRTVPVARVGHAPFDLTTAYFRGDAVVIDPNQLRRAMALGVGNAKCFGFGLLQLHSL